jgi:DNA-binding beta-propeller fold protein YncE
MDVVWSGSIFRKNIAVLLPNWRNTWDCRILSKGVFDSSSGLITGIAVNQSHTLLNKPAGIAVDPSNGDVYIADGYGDHRIAVFDRNGRFLRQWGRQGTKDVAAAGEGAAFMVVMHCVVMD